MSIDSRNSIEAEQERRRRLDELTAEYGAAFASQYGPGSFGCHELLDRTSMLAANVEDFLVSHPSCIQNSEWFALTEQAAAALHELYQRVGAESVTDADNE